MKLREIAEKYVYGRHDALTDSQEIKDMMEDIKNYANQQIKLNLEAKRLQEKLNELKESHAKKLGYKDWETFINDQPNYKVEQIMDVIALAYAALSYTEIFKNCGEGENVCNCKDKSECGYK